MSDVMRRIIVEHGIIAGVVAGIVLGALAALPVAGLLGTFIAAM
jgi:hypothetical protein